MKQTTRIHKMYGMLRLTFTVENELRIAADLAL
jgi:hypothetical protein